MVEIGVRSNDLPGVLTLLADYYHRANALWTRLKGLMVYPLIVLVVSTALTLVLSLLMTRFVSSFRDQLAPPGALVFGLWVPPVVLAALAGVGLAAMLLPSWRERLRWRLPAFREASLAQLASAIALMLKNGTTLAEALALAEGLETASPARAALARWRARVEAGEGKPAQWPSPTRPFPPLFLWLIQTGGEDAAAGFQKAADIYQARAGYRVELALYGALPVSVLFLGQMIVWQLLPFMQGMISIMNMLGGSGGLGD
jgi:type II secretory pathway component PulF